MASTRVTYTQVTPTDNKKWTWSGWFKRGTLGVTEHILTCYVDGNNLVKLQLASNDSLHFYQWSGASYTGQLQTNRLFRDVGAWYHAVIVWDSDNGTPGDRMKMYINGTEETSFATDNNPSSGRVSIMNADTRVFELGAANSAQYFGGEMSHVQFVDGLALAATDFGSFDATSGIWKIKTDCYATPGNNGVCLKMEDRTNLDLDSSSNAFTCTTGGTLTATYDNPSNNFCTLNPLDNYGGVGGSGWSVFSNGNTHWTTGVANHIYAMGTMGVSAGLWYWEVTNTVASAGSGYRIGVADKGMYVADSDLGQFQSSYAYGSYNGNIKYNATGSNIDVSFGDTYTNGDIIGVYMDLDAGKIYFGKNGTIQNIAAVNATNGFFMPSIADTNGNMEMNCNFGNGYFGTTAVTSGVADAGGEGTFEYDPSAGTFDSASKNFRALCTKNIKAYGG